MLMPSHDRIRLCSIQTVPGLRKLLLAAGAALLLCVSHVARAQEDQPASQGLMESGAAPEAAPGSSNPASPAPEPENTGTEAGRVKELIEITRAPTIKKIVLSGPLVPDETRTARVHSKFEGKIERVFADLKGKKVKKGRPLLSIDSPGFVSIQEELLRARKVKDSLSDSGFEEIGQGSASLYQATRERLKLYDISDQQMSEIEERGRPERTFIIESPADGFVINACAAKGLKVSPELELYAISDLSTVWMLAEVASYDLSPVWVGQSAAMTVDSFPGATFSGKVGFIYPESNPATHMTLIRLECPNRDLKLKPGMEARAEIKQDLGMKITVPAGAVLEAENGRIVFVAGEGGKFESRKIETGARIDDRIVIESGLNPGERILGCDNVLPEQKAKQP